MLNSFELSSFHVSVAPSSGTVGHNKMPLQEEEGKITNFTDFRAEII